MATPSGDVLMQAGSLDKRITIERKEVSRDTYGAEVIAWVPVLFAWAQVTPISGREFVEGRQLDEEVTTRIRMRYRQGVTPAMRVTLTGHIYDIVYVQDTNLENRELVLTCREML